MKIPPVAWIVVEGLDVLSVKYLKLLDKLKVEGYLVYAVQKDYEFLHILTQPEKVIYLGEYEDA